MYARHALVLICTSLPLVQLLDEGLVKSSLNALVSVVGHGGWQLPLALQVSPPVQSVSERHCTHAEVAPKSLQRGVAPPHALQLAPQAESLLHTAQLLPLQR